MDPLRNEQNFDLDKFSQKYHHSLNFLISVLRGQNWYHFSDIGINFGRVIQKYRKFANFAGLYFRHFTTFRNETLEFY